MGLQASERGSHFDWGAHVAARRPGESGSHRGPGILVSRVAWLAQPPRGLGADVCQAGQLEEGRGLVCEDGH